MDKLDVDKLETVPADLYKLNNAVDNNVVKKTIYDKLVIKADTVDTKINVLAGI